MGKADAIFAAALNRPAPSTVLILRKARNRMRIFPALTKATGEQESKPVPPR